MSLIDSILNLAGLLLWLNWRSLHFDPLASRKPATLIGTLKPATAAKARRWMILVSLPALLFFRALLYWQIGAPADWLPKLDLGAVVLVFRVDQFGYAAVFSVFSFLRFAAVAFFWFAALCIVNRRVLDPDPLLRLLRLQLGRFAQAPLVIQILFPLIGAVLFWAALHPLLSWAQTVGGARSASQVLIQGLLVTAGLLTTLKLLFPVLLLLHMLSSYVYLGKNPFWDFITITARNLLWVLPAKGLRTSRFDFAPLVAIVLILLVLHTVPTIALKLLANHGVTVWPE